MTFTLLSSGNTLVVMRLFGRTQSSIETVTLVCGIMCDYDTIAVVQTDTLIFRVLQNLRF